MRILIPAALACLALSACSPEYGPQGPTNSAAHDAFLAYAKTEWGTDASVTGFTLGDCTHAPDNSSYACDLKANVRAQDGQVDDDKSGTYTFNQENGELSVSPMAQSSSP